MISAWTSHLKDPVEIERFTQHLKSFKVILERQIELINERLKAIDTMETGVELYKQPGWEGLHAHYNGEKSALKWLKKLITLDPRSNDD